MLPALRSLIALQDLDTAAESARRRLADLPALEQQLDRRLALATSVLDQAKAHLATNQQSRREFEKQVAAIDSRLSRFDDHKAAVKTNQEFTALLHEIATAKTEKDSVEEQILVLMEGADAINGEIKGAEKAFADTRAEVEKARAALHAERGTFDRDLARLLAERATQVLGVDQNLLAKYEQLLKQRKMVAVGRLEGDTCTACHVRLRPAVTQQVRRNAEIVTCDSCQRILYFVPPVQNEAVQSATSS